MRRTFRLLALLMLPMTAAVGVAAESPVLKVAVTPSSANPTAGMEFSVEIRPQRAGRIVVQVVDRDGFVVRTLATGASAVAGLNRYTWNGRADDGTIVADEAYSLRIVWTDGKASETYFPAQTAVAMTPVPVRSFSAATGTIVYDLPQPSRVHLQAGVAAHDPRTNSIEGPVLKTVVNREPRAGGRIAEQWNGMDESGQIYVPDLANFVMSVATTPLPENSMIAVGNRTATFLAQAAARKGRSLFERPHESHQHHGGLSALDDVSPPLAIEPLNARWSETDQSWTMTSNGPLRLRLLLGGPAAHAFAAQPATLYRFANARLIDRSRIDKPPAIVEIPAKNLGEVLNVVSINWVSEYGGVAASSLRVRRMPSSPPPSPGARSGR